MNESPTDTSASSSADGLSDRFTGTLRPFLKFQGDEPLTPGSNLRTLGLDSMQAIELLFAIEDTFEVTLPEEAMNDTTFATAGNLWQEVRQALTAQHTGAATDPAGA
ncbi:acyl carrier protein [Streptomyces sp. AM 4-1-1]|uniref:acyl carrier protein n=1 Tax=Streptomyces sp. AM 4-1-1 TaxID=3028710 RepID=UPI0023B887D9|nr:acyl carrier protein [Streptomyces sp. AM 4-1-1]WEH37231.1 acyl carrier protein [Streptomyces sp. AM 4-1-1]